MENRRVNSWEIDQTTRIHRYPLRDVRESPGPVPETDIAAAPLRRLCINEHWAAHVAGAIDRLSDSDAWSGTESDIQRAQAAIDTIFVQLSELFDVCPEAQTVTEIITETVIEYVGGCPTVEDCMPCIDISSLLKLEGGVLYARNSCCEWVEIGNLAPPSETLPPDDTVTADPPPVDLACSKAATFAEVFGDVCRWGVDNWNVWNPINLVSWLNHINSNYSALSLERKWLIAAFYVLFPLKNTSALGLYDEDIPDNFEQWLTCGWAKVLNDLTLDVSADEYSQMKTVLNQNTSGVLSAYHTAMFNAFGVNSFRLLAESAQYIDSDACDCPASGDTGTGESEVSASGWYLSAPISASYPVPQPTAYPDYGFVYVQQTLLHDIYGLVAILNPVSGSMNHFKRTNDPAPNFMPAHDIYMSSTNSDNFPLSVTAAYAFINVNQFNELNAIGELNGWARVDPLLGDGSPDYSNPVGLAGESALMSFTVYDNTAGVVEVQLRWLHNVNSPSHS